MTDSHLVIAKDDGNNEDGSRLGFIASMMDGLPAEFQIFPYGQVELEGEAPFTVDDAAMDAVIQRFQARGLDMVIDYEHQTEGGDYASPDGTAPAAGWIKELEKRGEHGLWAKVEWLDKARQYLANKEYRYYSPVFRISKGERRLIELLRVALTNAPRLNWIKPIVAKQASTKTPKEKDMEFLRLCAKKLGLSDTATQEEVIAAVEALKTPREVVAREILTALDLTETAGKSEIVATIHALKQRPDHSAEIASMKKELAERKRDELVAAAIKEGKITPAQKEWADEYALRDPAGFKVFIAKASVVVPVGALNLASDKLSAKMDETQKEINKQLGIDDALFAKHNPKEK